MDTAVQQRKPEISIKKFMIYCTWNIIRYIAIAIMIFLANRRNINEINKYRKFCCDCYYVSKQPSNYGIASDIRFDLSYCIPECTDCNYCESFFNGNSSKAFNYDYINNPTCPLPQYSSPKSTFNIDWDGETGCGSHISYTSFNFFVKDYTAYGIWSIVVTSLYSLAIMGVMYYVYSTPNIAIILLRWILIYNILVSEIFLYLLFKPFQYYHKDINIPNNAIKDEITCEINSIHDDAVDVISWTIFMSVGLMILHFGYILYRLCGYLKVCYKAYKTGNRLRQESVSLVEMKQQINYGTGNGHSFDFIIMKHRCRWGLCGIIVGLLMMFFLCVSIYATYRMIEAGKQEFDDFKIIIISFVMTLIFLSLIDNPWILLKIKQLLFCCEDEDEDTRKVMLHSFHEN